MILAWLLLLTGLTISAVAIYYSVVGLAAIFSAAIIPIIVMGTTLEVAKLVCASWLKANWERVPMLMKTYMTTAVVVLMIITSMGIFGFLSKAHSDQSLVSGDVQSRLAIYDQKIQTAKENIEADRKQLKQMDEAVDQVMARSKDERGATNSNAIRRNQQKDRVALGKSIESNQKLIADLNDQAAPIRAEIRKVEAEVGPIKYIAAFIYGDNPDANLLEKAVTWVIIIIVSVFDPLAVIMLLAAQMTFGWRKETSEVATVPQALVVEELQPPVKTEPTLNTEQTHTAEVTSDTPSTALGGDITAPEEPVVPGTTESELEKWNNMIAEAEREIQREKGVIAHQEAEKYHPLENQFAEVTGDRVKPDLTEVIEPESDESKKKTYMTKDQTGKIQIKDREV
jgi:hypothetical protein